MSLHCPAPRPNNQLPNDRSCCTAGYCPLERRSDGHGGRDGPAGAGAARSRPPAVPPLDQRPSPCRFIGLFVVRTPRTGVWTTPNWEDRGRRVPTWWTPVLGRPGRQTFENAKSRVQTLSGALFLLKTACGCHLLPARPRPAEEAERFQLPAAGLGARLPRALPLVVIKPGRPACPPIVPALALGTPARSPSTSGSPRTGRPPGAPGGLRPNPALPRSSL